MKKALFKFWKILLVPIAIFFLLHFLKDIMHDILFVPSFLDALGGIKEDLSRLNEWQKAFYSWAWVNQFLLQPVLAFWVIKILKNKDFSKTDIFIAAILVYSAALFYWSFSLAGNL